MARGPGGLSKVQKVRNKEAAGCSLATRGLRQTAAGSATAPTKPTAGDVARVHADADRKMSAIHAEAQRKEYALKAALKKARQEKYNAERCRNRLQAKLTERRINTDSSGSTSSVPAPPSQNRIELERSPMSTTRRIDSDSRYLRLISRKLDCAGLGRKKRNRLMVAKQARVHVHREKRNVRVAAQEKKKALIDAVTPILDANYWRAIDKCSITIDKHIKPQLYWHQRAPSAKITVTAITTYNIAHTYPSSQSLPNPISSPPLITPSGDVLICHSGAETDEEEELLHS